MACNNPYSKVLIDKEYPMSVKCYPCGHCSGCRKDKLTMWTDRLEFELMTSPRRSGIFVTLTYDDDYVPRDGVRKEHVTKFLKDFRYRYDKRYGRTCTWNKNGDCITCSKYKYVFTSEYGDMHLRPHYHGIMTNADSWTEEDIVKDCWKYGYITCLPANVGSIRYVFKYIQEEDTRVIYRSDDGQVMNPNFHLFSQGIGKEYIFQHANEMRKDKGYRKGRYIRPLPPYYRQLLGIEPEPERISEDLAEKLNGYLRLHPEDRELRFNVLVSKCRQWYGLPAELSAQSKELNGIKHFKGLRSLNNGS